jgi:hypothetical protein
LSIDRKTALNKRKTPQTKKESGGKEIHLLQGKLLRKKDSGRKIPKAKTERDFSKQKKAKKKRTAKLLSIKGEPKVK